MVKETYVKQQSLDPRQASPDDPVRGMVNDFFDSLGFPRPDEVIPSPADFVKSVGFPTMEEVVPTPKEVGERLFSGQMGRLPVPPKPPLPREFVESGGY